MDPRHEHRPDAGWRTAISATGHCLTGCAIGEVLGMVLAAWWGLLNLESIVLSMVLAFFFGYLLTVTAARRTGLGLRSAVRIALAADTASILVMELVDNGFVAAVPGALDAGLGDALFWWSLVASLAIAFVVTVPVNRAMISRGRGHAVAHRLHQH